MFPSVAQFEPFQYLFHTLIIYNWLQKYKY
nr:MAG TPA: hypothetical protein [Caudoviricetes sp.]